MAEASGTIREIIGVFENRKNKINDLLAQVSKTEEVEVQEEEKSETEEVAKNEEPVGE